MSTEICGEAMDALVHLLGAERAAALLRDPDEVSRFKAWLGLSDHLRAVMEGHSPWVAEHPDPQPVLVNDIRSEPDLQAYRDVLLDEGIQGLGFIPLVAQGRLMGTLMVSYPQPHPWSAAEAQLAQMIASQVAPALDRAQMEADVRENRDRLQAALARSATDLAERQWAERRAAVQYTATIALSEASSMDQAAPLILRAVGEHLDWQLGSFWTVDQREAVTRCLATWSAPSFSATEFQEMTRRLRFPLGAGLPGQVWEQRSPVWIADLMQSTNFPRLPVAAREGLRSGFAFPILLGDEVLGVLEFFSDQVRQADPQVVQLVTAIGSQLGQFLRRKRAEAGLHFLNDASSVLAGTLQYEETLQSVARLAVPFLADHCVIYLKNDRGDFRGAASAHVDPDKERLLELIRERYRPDPLNGQSIIARVLRTGEPNLVVAIPEDTFDQITDDPELRNAFRQIQPRSGLVMPLRARGRIDGAIAFVSSEPERYYGPEDMKLAEDLARRCALAIDNARLYQASLDAVRQREEFLSVAAHELKTPITSLRGFAQLALRQFQHDGQIDPSRWQRSLEMIDQQSDKLSRLVAQLLDISRIQSGQLVLELQDVDLFAVVQSAANVAHSIARRHVIKLHAVNPVNARIDPLRFEQVMVNLIENAMKYSPDGTPIEIEIALADAGPAQVSVTDYGVGIPEEHRDLIFDRFYQAHGPGAFAGMGLGLFISRQIIELHGGTISAEFPEAGGTRFVVAVPTGDAGEGE